jgi:hypothetical protein
MSPEQRPLHLRETPPSDGNHRKEPAMGGSGTVPSETQRVRLGGIQGDDDANRCWLPSCATGNSRAAAFAA